MLVRQLVPLRSSYIAAAGWSNGRMAIRFRSGRVKFYSAPVTIWQQLMKAPSAGKFFNENIKGKFGRSVAGGLGRTVSWSPSGPMLNPADCFGVSAPNRRNIQGDRYESA